MNRRLREVLWLLELLPIAGLGFAAWVAVKDSGRPAQVTAAISAAVLYAAVRLSFRRLRDCRDRLARKSEIQHQSLEALALAIDARDPSGAGHARRVQACAREIGQLVQEQPDVYGAEDDPAWLENLTTAALLHDVGKLGVPDFLLSRRRPLSRAEQEKLRQHAALGQMVVEKMPLPKRVAKIVRSHHERWDGAGYPDGLAASNILLEARIVALADQLDAARRRRPDGTFPSVEELVIQIARSAGSRLDPRLAALYCAHAEEIERRLAELNLGGAEDSQEQAPDDPLVARLREAPRQAAALFDLSSNIGASLQVEETLDLVAGRLLELIPAHSCGLFLADPTHGQLAPRFAIGPLAESLLRRSFRRGEGAIGWTYSTGGAVVNADPRTDLGDDCERESAPTKSALVAAIADGRRILGVVAFYSSEANAFTDDHVRIIEMVTPKLAQALNNALLFAETLASSYSDPLTGLPNNRFLQTQAEKDLARAVRRGSPLSVAVLDLDGFKEINDRRGHLVGDEVLRGFARALRECFRTEDVVTRYAGDEFVVLLPDTSPENAWAIVRRVQENIAESPVQLSGGGSIHIAFSAGIAGFPQDGANLEELLRRADAEMYADKAARRTFSVL